MKDTKVNAGLAESNGSLLLGIWRDSLHVTCGLTACTPGSAPGPTLGNEYGKTLPFTYNRDSFRTGCLQHCWRHGGLCLVWRLLPVVGSTALTLAWFIVYILPATACKTSLCRPIWRLSERKFRVEIETAFRNHLSVPRRFTVVS